jgi:hypothetical protein
MIEGRRRQAGDGGGRCAIGPTLKHNAFPTKIEDEKRQEVLPLKPPPIDHPSPSLVLPLLHFSSSLHRRSHRRHHRLSRFPPSPSASPTRERRPRRGRDPAA